MRYRPRHRRFLGEDVDRTLRQKIWIQRCGAGAALLLDPSPTGTALDSALSDIENRYGRAKWAFVALQLEYQEGGEVDMAAA